MIIYLQVRVIKSGIENGTVTVMWEKVEKANEYRVGIIPRGTGTVKVHSSLVKASRTGSNVRSIQFWELANIMEPISKRHSPN